MGWADDMYAAGLTPKHGGLMSDSWYRDDTHSLSTKRKTIPKESNKGKPWTSADRFKVITLFTNGQSVEDIAEEFKRTPYAIAWQLFNLDKISSSQREKFKAK